MFTLDSSGNAVCLSGLAPVRGLKFSHGLPGGPLSASWSLLADPHFNHVGLRHGRTVVIVGGGGNVVWTGTLSAPKRGDPWECEAVGLGARANGFRAYAPTTGNLFNLTEVLGDAVARGLPWTLPASLPSGYGDWTTRTDKPVHDVSESLERVTNHLGKTWWVDNYGTLNIDYPLSTPNLLLCPRDAGGGRTISLDSYVSAYLVTYVSSTTGASTDQWVRDADRETRFGVVEKPLNLTKHGTMTSTQATNLANLRLLLHGARAPFTNQLTLSRGQILTTGGVAVDPATVFPPSTGRLILTDPDRAGELYLSNPTDIVIQQTDYDDDLDVLTVTPWDTMTSGSGLPGVLVEAAQAVLTLAGFG